MILKSFRRYSRNKVFLFARLPTADSNVNVAVRVKRVSGKTFDSPPIMMGAQEEQKTRQWLGGFSVDGLQSKRKAFGRTESQWFVNPPPRSGRKPTTFTANQPPSPLTNHLHRYFNAIISIITSLSWSVVCPYHLPFSYCSFRFQGPSDKPFEHIPIFKKGFPYPPKALPSIRKKLRRLYFSFGSNGLFSESRTVKFWGGTRFISPTFRHMLEMEPPQR